MVVVGKLSWDHTIIFAHLFEIIMAISLSYFEFFVEHFLLAYILTSVKFASEIQKNQGVFLAIDK